MTFKYLLLFTLLIIPVNAYSQNKNNIILDINGGAIFFTGNDSENLKPGPSLDLTAKYFFLSNFFAGLSVYTGMPDTKAEDQAGSLNLTVFNIIAGISAGWIGHITGDAYAGFQLDGGYTIHMISGGGNTNRDDGLYLGIKASFLYKIRDNLFFTLSARYGMGFWKESCAYVDYPVNMEICSTQDLDSWSITAGVSVKLF